MKVEERIQRLFTSDGEYAYQKSKIYNFTLMCAWMMMMMMMAVVAMMTILYNVNANDLLLHR